MDIVVYGVLKKYVDETLVGGGALKGKNCTIASITSITGGHRVTFGWELDDGTEQTGYIDVMDGADGAQGQQGPTGQTGPAGPGPTITVKTSTDTEYVLHVVAGNGEFDTVNLKGNSGDYAGLENKPQINGVTLNGNKSLADLNAVSEDEIAVNMIPFPFSAGSGSGNGVTWVVNADGTITISTAEGGATGTQYIGLVLPAKHVTIPDGDYCLHINKVSGITLIADAYDKTALTSVKRYASTDEEATFTKDDGDSYYTALVVTVAEGTEITTPVTVKPMLETGSVAHPFVPYIGEGKTIPEVIGNINDNMDGWTNTAQVDSNGQVAFTGLSDSLAYSLFVQNKLVSITSVTKTGSGNNVTLTYTLSGAETGDVCKLRISK